MPSLARGIGMQSILKVCVANLGDRLRWMSSHPRQRIYSDLVGFHYTVRCIIRGCILFLEVFYRRLEHLHIELAEDVFVKTAIDTLAVSHLTDNSAVG